MKGVHWRWHALSPILAWEPHQDEIIAKALVFAEFQAVGLSLQGLLLLQGGWSGEGLCGLADCGQPGAGWLLAVYC